MRLGLDTTFRGKLYGAAAMSCAMCVWVLVEVVAAQISPDYSLYQVVWVRYGVHLVLIFFVLGRRRVGRLFRTRRPGLQILRSALMVGMPVLFIWIPRFGSVHDAWPAFWVAPLLVMGLSVPLLGERPGRHRWVATGLGLLGALLALRASWRLFEGGALLALASGTCFALYVVLTRRLMGETLESRLFYTATVPFVSLTPVMLFLWHAPTPRVLLLMVLVGVGGLACLWALDLALDLAQVSFGAVFMFTEVLCELGLAAVSGAMPGKRGAIGAFTIVAAGAWVLYTESRRRQEA